MDTKHDDGGPAYPVNKIDLAYANGDGRYGVVTQLTGETIWDRYAAAALQGELASQSEEGAGVWTAKIAPALAELCADYADAMLAERRKRGIGQ